MGKMKRARQKLHTAAARAKKNEQIKKSNSIEDEPVMDLSPSVPTDPAAGVPRGENLFQNVKISSSDLVKQKLPDFDARSTITSKTFKGQNLKKKDKHKIRREAWTAKIDMIQTTKKKARERKRKQQTPIVGDLTAMEDALPTLELLMKESTDDFSKRQPEEKPRSIPKEKKRKKQMLDDMALFSKVVAHPVFQGNASQAIKEHLKNMLHEVGEESMKS
ncbi:unnamed protein product [Candidula unifasciata]|uniref:Ribosome biogenesis protein SLX9 n=1 Tax=Candidula unifasciata TaxID=100452 RepID=A0A8S3ZYV0_9EUPU|nr:unnamed protein product [Candidula unifasciata]